MTYKGRESLGEEKIKEKEKYSNPSNQNKIQEVKLLLDEVKWKISTLESPEVVEQEQLIYLVTKYLYYGMLDEPQRSKYKNYEKSLFSLIEKSDFYHMVTMDHLTGLKNRAGIDNYIRQLNDYKNLVCIIFDIDEFKKINDSYGHQAGDEVLKEVAKISQKYFGEIGIVARYGGDEFIVFIKDEDLHENDTKEIAQKMLYNIQCLEFTTINTTITVSLGIADTNLSEIEDISELIYQADMNLYKAKRLGKNRVC